MQKKTVRDIPVEGKRVLVRVDFNVPMDMEAGIITDDSRIRASLPTIRYLVAHGAKVILCSHLGRPKGKVVEGLRMAPVAQRLSELLELPVETADDCIGEEVKTKVKMLGGGDILLLENLRFHPEEEANDPSFAKELAGLADLYVDDAFGTSHRAHASTVGVAQYLPAVAGFLLEKELEALGHLLSEPQRPFACMIGGAKVSDKMGLLQNMLRWVDILLIGGGMVATFLKAMGYEVGNSPIEVDKLELAKELLQESGGKRTAKILLPVDVVVAPAITPGIGSQLVSIDGIPSDSLIVDIGPNTIELFSNELRRCHTVMWNGPVGVYEVPPFDHGTRSLVSVLSSLSNATTIVGGGSSAEVIQEMGLGDKVTHVSTGGGASLRFLEGTPLPGVEVLLDREER
ncbi:MAG: phosphoglycerate kinase [Chloroflexi bacterium CG15_BIG_FIL_POST_REV_8_21_14_020_46_15]|nr:MAG: phosphoglycerate kinase [Chloroflexi bacterium CG15_BIG_FIL_POST_REV_8_21_14_020_46_15]